MRWKLVVLPAPFGPISASVSFSATVKLTSCTARRPPKRLLKPDMTRAFAMIASGARRLAREVTLPGLVDQSHQPGRPPQDHRHQDQRIDRKLDAARGRAKR